MKDYHINIFFSEDDEGYIADIPDLKHCSAFGESPQEALNEVLKAKEAWMAAARAKGKPVPPPQFRPSRSDCLAKSLPATPVGRASWSESSC